VGLSLRSLDHIDDLAFKLNFKVISITIELS
ncbi:uncharacterized protein METZ01_LOCUS233740, partial [marine metagenome]